MLKKKRFSKPLLIMLTVSIFIGLHLFVALAILLTLIFYAFGHISRWFFNTHSMILNKGFKNKSADIASLWSSGSSSVKYIAVGNTQRIVESLESSNQLTQIHDVEGVCSQDTLKIIWINR